MKALVYYADGVSGTAAAERLAERGDEVVPVDRTLGNEDDLALLDGVDVVVKTPGVPPAMPLARRGARERGVPVWSEVELGFRLLPGARFVGVTGTNGKTTTTALLGAIFRAAGRARRGRREHRHPAHLGARGRLGRLRAVVVPARGRAPVRVRVAVLLNLEPDHLDRHGSFEAYRDAKLRIFERARAKVVPRGLGLEGIEFAADDPLPAEPLIRGAHNRENAAAATAAARAAGIGDERDRRGAAHVPGRAAPARARRRGRRRALRQRLEGDERRRGAARARRVRGRAGAPDPRRLARRARASRRSPPRSAPNVRSVHLVGAAAAELAAALSGRSHDDGTLARAVAHAAERGASPATSSCSARPARATTSTRTSSSAATSSAGSSPSLRSSALRAMSRFQRDRSVGEEQRATTLELFYDLVFVFAITQVSHILLADLSWRGAAQAMLVLRGRLVGVELHGVGHERARPRLDRRPPAAARADVREPADGGRDPGGVRRRGRCSSPASYVTIQVGRHLFLTFVVGLAGDDRAASARRAS